MSSSSLKTVDRSASGDRCTLYLKWLRQLFSIVRLQSRSLKAHDLSKSEISPYSDLDVQLMSIYGGRQRRESKWLIGKLEHALDETLKCCFKKSRRLAVEHGG